MKLTDEQLENFKSDLTDAGRERGIAVSALTELQIRRQLQEFCGHKYWCPKNRSASFAVSPECTCGLGPLLSKLKKLEGV